MSPASAALPRPIAVAAAVAAAAAGVATRIATRLATRFGDRAVAERDRWFCWLPVLVGIGVGVYFALPAEPPAWTRPLFLAATLLAAAIALVRREWRQGNGLSMLAWIAAAALLLGFTASLWRTEAVRAPRIEARIGPVAVRGRVARIEALPAAARVTLDELAIRALGAARTPERVRLRFPAGAAGLRPGDRIRVDAVLSPLPAPTSPGAFDFQRFAWFQRLGGIGTIVGDWQRLPPPPRIGPLEAAWQAIARLRLAIAERIRSHQGGAAGEMMVALVTGEQTGLPAPAMAALRDSGLAHLLSISGLHIGMVGGILFFWVRALIAAVPWLCLRVPAKKLAAAVAIAGAGFYVLLAAAPVPTQRAFFMLAIVMLAVIVDRRAISMRLVAWAAVIILATQPDALLGASFQMSFAAMVALVALYEAVSGRRGDLAAPAPLRRGLLYVGSILASTVVATLATAPFAIHHFNRLALFGALANLIAIPLTGFVVMPAAVLAALLMPFGLEAVPLAVMAWGTASILAVAAWAAALPAAAVQLPLLPTAGLVLISLGGLWLCLWRTRWRLAGLAGIALGLLTMAWVRPPDILIDGDGGLIAVRLADGRLLLSSTRARAFTRRAWQQRLGEADQPLLWPAEGQSDDGRLACDPLGCILTQAGHRVALPRRPEALIDDCGTVDLVVSAAPLAGLCAATPFIDAASLARGGGHAVWLTPAGIRVSSVDAVRGRRPWVKPPPAATDDGDAAAAVDD